MTNKQTKTTTEVQESHLSQMKGGQSPAQERTLQFEVAKNLRTDFLSDLSAATQPVVEEICPGDNRGTRGLNYFILNLFVDKCEDVSEGPAMPMNKAMK